MVLKSLDSTSFIKSEIMWHQPLGLKTLLTHVRLLAQFKISHRANGTKGAHDSIASTVFGKMLNNFNYDVESTDFNIISD